MDESNESIVHNNFEQRLKIGDCQKKIEISARLPEVKLMLLQYNRQVSV